MYKSRSLMDIPLVRSGMGTSLNFSDNSVAFLKEKSASTRLLLLPDEGVGSGVTGGGGGGGVTGIGSGFTSTTGGLYGSTGGMYTLGSSRTSTTGGTSTLGGSTLTTGGT